MRKHYFYTLAVALAIPFSGLAQQRSDLQALPLQDLSAFENQAGNWRIVGDVTMDRNVDVHHEEKKPEPVPAKKGKKSKNEPAPPAGPQPVTFTEGTGVLLNINDESRKDNLLTKMKHGDIEIEFEVMLPKGSNSGFYLQGRYEVQLFDSWGVKNAKFTDMGGIYRNWENEAGKLYMGKAPLTNAAKAPGLWQKMEISFRAPRFDASGKKTENARFNRVTLNGVVIHENVEVPLPTGGAIDKLNESAIGPILIQGDHGPVAFRNIRYRLLKELNYGIGPVSYNIYHGNFKSVSDFQSSKPEASGTTKELTCEVLDVDNEYGVHYKGTVTVPEDAKYTFQVTSTGGTKFIVNNQELFYYPTFDGFRSDTASITLKAGTYPFEILNFKGASWLPPRLALHVRTGDSPAVGLHALNSFPPSDDPVASIFMDPGKDPKIIRAFVDFKGNRKERLTHTVGVGDPSGMHYIYDLKSGNLVCVWKGDFVDATPMWHDRGDGSFRPRGYALFLTNNQALAYLPSDKDAFPAVSREDQFRSKGYTIEESTGRPLFHYTYQGIEFDDRVFPDNNNQVISHEIVLKKGQRNDGLFYKVAEGSSIVEMGDGTFAVNDKEYYVKVEGGAKPVVREVNGKKELIVAFPLQVLKYSIIW